MQTIMQNQISLENSTIHMVSKKMPLFFKLKVTAGWGVNLKLWDLK